MQSEEHVIYRLMEGLAKMMWRKSMENHKFRFKKIWSVKL